MRLSVSAATVLLWLFCVPSIEGSPVHNTQNSDLADSDDRNTFSSILLLSALDVEKILSDGLNDALSNVITLLIKKLPELGITINRSTYGYVDVLKNIFLQLLSSDKVSSTSKRHIRSLLRYVRNKEQPLRPKRMSSSSPAHGTWSCPSNNRLFMVPFDFSAIKTAGLTSALNRVVSFVNKHSSEVLFVDQYFDSDSPLLPFLVLLNSPTAEKQVKEDIRSILPYLRSTLSPESSGVVSSIHKNLEVNDETVEEKGESTNNDDEHRNLEPSLFMRLYNEMDSKKEATNSKANKSSDQSFIPPGITETPEVSVLQRSSFDTKSEFDGILKSSVLPFDLLKISQDLVTDKLKKSFAVFQMILFNSISVIEENMKHTKEVLQELYNKFLFSANSDKDLKYEIESLKRYTGENIDDNLGKGDRKLSIQKISEMIKNGLLRNLKTICEINKNDSTEIVSNKNISELLIQMGYKTIMNDESEHDIRTIFEEICGSQAMLRSSELKTLDSEKLTQIETLLTEYELQRPITRRATHALQVSRSDLEDDIDKLVQNYISSFAKIPHYGDEENYLSDDIRLLMRKLGVPDSLRQTSDSYLTVVVLPSAGGTRDETTFEAKLKDDIRSLVDKCWTFANGTRKHSLLETPDIYEEIKRLPLELDKLIHAGCYESLVRLYKYFKELHYDRLVMSLNDKSERSSVFRDLIGVIRHTDSVNIQVRRDANCVSPFIEGEEFEVRRTESKLKKSRRYKHKKTGESIAFNMYTSAALWPIDRSQIAMDGHQENLQRVTEHLHNHYHDLLISTQRSAARRNRVFREVLEKILHSDTVKDELKDDVKIIMPYVKPIASKRITNTSLDDMNLNRLLPVNMNKIVNSGLSESMDRVIKLCKNNSCDKILDPVKNTSKQGNTFRKLLEIFKSFGDTNEQLKKDINAISPYVVDTNSDNEIVQRRRRKAVAHARWKLS